jgi:hypothetical protein
MAGSGYTGAVALLLCTAARALPSAEGTAVAAEPEGSSADRRLLFASLPFEHGATVVRGESIEQRSSSNATCAAANEKCCSTSDDLYCWTNWCTPQECTAKAIAWHEKVYGEPYKRPGYPVLASLDWSDPSSVDTLHKVVTDLAAAAAKEREETGLAAPAADCDAKDAKRIKMLKKWRSAGQNWANKCITFDGVLADGGVDEDRGYLNVNAECKTLNKARAKFHRKWQKAGQEWAEFCVKPKPLAEGGTLNVLMTSQCFATTSCLDYNAWYIPRGLSTKLGMLWAQAAAKACYASMEVNLCAAHAPRVEHHRTDMPQSYMGMYGPCTGSKCAWVTGDYTSVIPVDAFGEVVVDEEEEKEEAAANPRCADVAKKKQCKKLNGCKWKKALCKAK